MSEPVDFPSEEEACCLERHARDFFRRTRVTCWMETLYNARTERFWTITANRKMNGVVAVHVIEAVIELKEDSRA